MKDRQRLRCRGLMLGAAGAAAALLGAGGPAYAADEIPRPPGAIEHRAYELVNLPDKNHQNDGNVVYSVDGESVVYGVWGGNPVSTGGAVGLGLASRTAGGWTSRTLMPPVDQLLGRTYGVIATDPDLSRFFVQAWDGGLMRNLPSTYAWLDRDRQQVPLFTFRETFDAVGSGIASADMAHVVTYSEEPLAAGHVPGTGNLYDWGSGTPRLVSPRPGSTDPFACGVMSNGTDGNPPVEQTKSELNWLSEDGDVVFFQSSCGGTKQLYRHSTAAGGTVLVSGPVRAGADQGIRNMLRAAPDGSWAVYVTETRLDAADTDGSLDVYRWTAAGGNRCVSCAAVRAAATAAGRPVQAAAVYDADNGAVSADGEIVYFVSATRDLDPDPAAVARAGALNLYVIDHGRLSWVAPVTATYTSVAAEYFGSLTADGRFAFFRSRAAALNPADGRHGNGGTEQWYRFDLATKTTTCVSCPEEGAPGPVTPNASLMGRMQVSWASTYSEDGSRYFFMSDEPLVTADVNGGADIYEWHDGEIGLITDGKEERIGPLVPKMVGVAAGGRDFFFWDAARLTRDGQDDNFNLYVARVDGGFQPRERDAETRCEGDGCQGRTADPRRPTDPATIDAEGDDATGPPATPQARISLVAPTAAQRTALARTGRIVLRARVTVAGTVKATATAPIGGRPVTVATGRATAGRAGTVRVALSLSGRARRALRSGGTLRTTIAVALGSSARAKMTVVLKAPAKGRR